MRVLVLHQMKCRFWLVLALLLILFSCRKKEDDVYPTVQIITPSAGTSFDVFDSILASVKVSDDQHLELVQLDVITESNAFALPAEQRTEFDSLDETVNIVIEIDDVHLESGTYFLRAMVSDGTNEQFAFREIQIIEAPLQLLSTCVISNPFENESRLDTISGSSSQQVFSWGKRVNTAAVNSWNTEILMVAETSGDIQHLVGSDIEPSTIHPNQGNGSNPHFNEIIYDSETRRYYLSRYESKVEVRNPGGALALSFDTQMGKRPYQIGVSADYIIVEERDFDETTTHISAYFRSSGELYQSLVLEANEVCLIGIDGDDIWIWANDDSGELWEFDAESGLLILQHTFSEGLIRTGSFIEQSGLAAISFESSTHLMNPQNPGQSIATWSQPADEIDYDVVSNIYLLREAETVYSFVSGQGSAIGSANLPANPVEILLLYNK